MIMTTVKITIELVIFYNVELTMHDMGNIDYDAQNGDN